MSTVSDEDGNLFNDHAVHHLVCSIHSMHSLPKIVMCPLLKKIIKKSTAANPGGVT